MKKAVILIIHTEIEYCKLLFDTGKITFYKNYFCSVIPAEVIQWIIDYLEVFMGPDAEEGFIVTTIMQSPYKTWIKYNKGASRSLTYTKPYRNNHPQILYKEDIEEAEASGMYFARKIDSVKSAEFIEYFYGK